MSASTWVDSSHKRHKFRLYFASAARSSGLDGYDGHESDDDFGDSTPEDVIVDLSELIRDPGGIAVHGKAPKLYLDWARQAGPDAITKLTGQVEAVHLGISEEVDRAVSMLPTSMDTRIPEILDEIAAARRREDTAKLDEYVQHLRRRLADPRVVIDRARCQELIVAKDLLREASPAIPAASLDEFLDALLAVIVGTHLDYQGYRQVSECARRRMHHPLLRAMGKLTLVGSVPVILICYRLGYDDKRMFQELRRWGVAADGPLRELAEDTAQPAPKLSRQHGMIVYDIGLQYAFTGLRDVRPILREVGYLDRTIAHLYHLDEAAQLNRLRYLLNDLYGHPLRPSAIRDIVARRDGAMPSPLLVKAVDSMTPRPWKPVVARAVRTAWVGNERLPSLMPLPRSRRRGLRRRLRRWVPVRAVPRFGFMLGLAFVLILIGLALLSSVLHHL